MIGAIRNGVLREVKAGGGYWMQDSVLDPDDNRVVLIPGQDGCRVALIGEVDYAARGKLDDVFAELTEHPPGDVVADLAETTFLDSVGLGFLVRVHRWVTDSGFRLTVAAPPTHVRRAMMLTGLDRVLTVTPAQRVGD
jgi:anti-sigma B factor antagonist